MKKYLNKLISIVLCISIIVTALVFYIPTAFADNNPGTDIPLIYVVGQGVPLAVTENGKKRDIYPIEVPKDELIKAAKENIDVFAKAVVTQEWKEFGDTVRDIVAPIFKELALDENGRPINGSTSRNGNLKSKIKTAKVNGKYPTTNFSFNYDWRLDPYEVADSLHQYIEDVMAVTGADHVALSGRCLGACVTTAYMEKYDGEHISDFILYCSALNGAELCSKAFSGDIYYDPDAVERFVYDLDLFSDDLMNELFESFVTIFNDTYGLDLACWSINNVLPDIYLDILPQTLIETMGTWPGFWAMVNDRDYEQAKETVFHNQDPEKWAHFIDIIDNYHYNVQLKAPELLKKFEERGIEISNITKYGYQAVPLSDTPTEISDSYCPVTDASMGAVTTTLDTVFDNNYLAAAQANGTAKYISPDLQIDASTCLFPETTWFVKNVKHKTFPNELHFLLDEIVNHDGFTIDSNPEYPQFIVYRDGKLSPMNAENQNTTERYNVTFWDALKTFIRSLNKIIINLIKDKIGSGEVTA